MKKRSHLSRTLGFSCWLFFAAINFSFSQSFRVIMVPAFDSAQLGPSYTKDVEVIIENFQKISQSIGYNFVSMTLVKDKFNASAIKLALDTIKVSPQDVLFFYYTGHGYNTKDNNTKFTALSVNDFESNPITLDEISQKLKDKKARLCITLGDCCNNIISLGRGMGKPIKPKGTGLSDDDITILKKLFLYAKGSVKIASSEKGQKSNAFPEGSAYTLAFEKAFEESINKNNYITWEQLLGDIQNRLDNLLSNVKQTSIYEIELGDAPAPPSPPNPKPDPTPPTPIPPSPPVPLVTFDQINKFLNFIADERKPAIERQQIMKQIGNYFMPKAHVKLFVNETEVESQAIERLITRLYLNAEKIREVI